MSIQELSNFIFDDREEQRSFNEFAEKFNKGGVKLSQLSKKEIWDTINQFRNIKKEIRGMTEVVVKPLSPQRAAEIKLTEEFQSLQSGFVSIENELAPKNSLMPDPTASDFYKVEAVRHVQEKTISDFSRKKQEAQNKSREAKDEHAKFLSSPEGIRAEWERRHGKEQKSNYDYLFSK